MSVENCSLFFLRWRTGQKQVGRQGVNGTRCGQPLVSLVGSRCKVRRARFLGFVGLYHRCKGIRSGGWGPSIYMPFVVLIRPMLPIPPLSGALWTTFQRYSRRFFNLSPLLQSLSLPNCGLHVYPSGNTLARGYGMLCINQGGGYFTCPMFRL